LIVLAFAFAELVDNALAATAGNKGLRKIEIQLVGDNLLQINLLGKNGCVKGLPWGKGGGAGNKKRGKDCQYYTPPM
jgi:hypothetical protein